MNLWEGNRFKTEEELPSAGEYLGELCATIPHRSKGPKNVIFLFAFEHEGKQFKAGIEVETDFGSPSFRELLFALGHRCRPGAVIKTSELMGRCIHITIQHQHDERGFWFIGIRDYGA